MLVLDNHLGEVVQVEIFVPYGTQGSVRAMEVVGELSRTDWQMLRSVEPDATPAALDSELAGVYRVGDFRLDLTNLENRDIKRSMHQAGGKAVGGDLRITLAERTQLHINWDRNERPAEGSESREPLRPSPQHGTSPVELPLPQEDRQATCAVSRDPLTRAFSGSERRRW